MKKFIFALALCLISIMSYGQYRYSDRVYNRPIKVDKFSQYPSINNLSNEELVKTNFTNLYEYKVARKKITKGTINSIVGMGIETAGSLLMIQCIENEVFESSTVCGPGFSMEVEKPNYWPGIISGVLMLGGAIEFIVGVCQIYSGAYEIRDLKFNYAVRCNGVVISF